MKQRITAVLAGILGPDVPVELSIPEDQQFGHFSTNVAMRLAKERRAKPLDLATELAVEIVAKAPAGLFEKVEAAAPGFVNFWLSKETIQNEFASVSKDDSYGADKNMKGETVMVEFTDPNPFKLFHIGHLMSNTIGESFSRVYEAMGATVVRANYQGDIGMHVAKAVWGMERLSSERPNDVHDLFVQTVFLGQAYAKGAGAYEEDPEAKKEIEEINIKLYDKSDPSLNARYNEGRAWSLAYFETVYQRLGTKFKKYYFESEIADEGAAVVRAHPEVFVLSEGATVFPGEKYGLHTRVFINSKGLPTYEAKEIGLNKKKFEDYPSLDLSVVVTGNEINDYFKVLMKAMELVMPGVAGRTKHVSHGMLRLPTGKMSSRTGDVITAESLLDQVKAKLKERVSERPDDLNADERAVATEAIAVGAVKYSILKQAPGQDIVFDFDKSLAVDGDSGPYLQYAYARLRSIMRKAGGEQSSDIDPRSLDSEPELALMRKIFEFPDVVVRAGETRSSSGLANYLYKLAVHANKFYETTPILKDDHEARRHARLALAGAAARTLKIGLDLLGIATLEKI